MSRIMVICSRARSLVNFRGALLAAWVNAGHEVHAVCPTADRGHPAIEVLFERAVQVHFVRMDRTGTRFFRDLLLCFDLLMLMIRLQPRYLLAYTVKPVVYGVVAAAISGVPNRFALITGLGHAFIGQSKSLTSVIVRRLYAIAMAVSTKVFFQNPDDFNLFIESGLLKDRERALVVNGSGVDLDHYAFAPLPEGPTTFLFVGRLLKAKGVREFAEAAIALRKQYPAARCRIVGWIDDNPDSIAPALVDDWRKEGIEFLGHLDDVRPALRQCTVFVLPSYREGTPRTVLEAMAMGRPIITTDAPGCRETVERGVNGWLVEAGSAKALLAAMGRALGDRGVLEAMGVESRRIAEEKYDVRLVTAAMLAGMSFPETAHDRT